MDPCPFFVRLTLDSLALRLPETATIKHFPSQKALLPVSSFSDADAIRRVPGKKISLRVTVYAGRTGHTCGVTLGLHLLVRAEPDPRLVFQFGGEPECIPVV